MQTATFENYIGIDYSGAQAPTSSLKGLRLYIAEQSSMPLEVQPPPSPRKYWTRRGMADWLVEYLAKGAPTLVGIDHGFSFPLRYFEAHHLAPDWPAFLDDFQEHWPTDEDHVYVDFVREGSVGDGGARSGSSRWRRLTEERAGAKSVFHFDVPGSVAKSTHAGIPWLHFIRQNLKEQVHFWPFDAWDVPNGRSVIMEVYPSLWNKMYPREGRTGDQHDAWSVARWLPFIRFDSDCRGEFMFICVSGGMDCYYGESDASFTWVGSDEMEEASGAGEAEVGKDGILTIEIKFHLGDEAILKARKW